MRRQRRSITDIICENCKYLPSHFLGDAVALVAAEDCETLERAKALVRVEYEELPGVFSPAEATSSTFSRF